MISMKYLVFGYGTFITNKIYKKYKNPKPAFLMDYYRIFRKNEGDWFPYILHKQVFEITKNNDKNNKSEKVLQIKPGFWGIVFEVDEDELYELDKYEGLEEIYKRIEDNVMLKDGTILKAMIYYPNDKTIKQKRLKDFLNERDLWLDYMKENFKEIINEFPELIQNSRIMPAEPDPEHCIPSRFP